MKTALSTRITAGVVLMSVVLTAGFVYSGKVVLETVESALFTLTQESQAAAVAAVLEGHETVLVAHGRALGRERDMIALIAGNDLDALTENVRSTYNRMSAAGEITDLAIFGIDGQPLASFPAEVERAAPALVRTVIETERPEFGFVRIDEARFASTHVFALREGRDVVAIAMVAQGMANTLPEIAETIGGTALLTRTSASGAHAVDLVAVPEQQDAASGEGDADAAAAGADASPTPAGSISPEAVADAAQASLAQENGAVGLVTLGDAAKVVSRVRLGETAGGDAVDLLLVSDFAAQQAAKVETIRTALAVMLGVVAAIVAGTLFWLRGQLRPLKETTVALSALAHGAKTDRRSYKRAASEIADLNSALDAFVEQAERMSEQARQNELQAEEMSRQAREIEARAERDAARGAEEAKRVEQARREADEVRRREQRAAAEIAQVVAACAEGDFTQKLSVEDKDGIFRDLCAGMNRIGESASAGLGDVQDALGRLAEGDLSHRMPDRYKGVFAEIRLGMNATADKLATTLREISASASTVRETTADIASATMNLSRQTEMNAATLEETAAALEEMSVSVKSSAGSADLVRKAMEEIDGRARSGNEVVRNATGAMDEIASSSQAISKIIHVIDDIAFQTNLLALNAGVEAARAGDSGRGFAVVASEVRALAQRSAEAAREISSLIQNANKSVQKGVDLVAASGSALQSIVDRVQAVSDQVREIAASAEQTATGVDEISSAANSLDRATQHNAAIFEETTAAVQTLQRQADGLETALRSFTVRQIDGESGSRLVDAA